MTDGKSYKILPYAKDYKRIGEGDTGLNTGGMGSISPVPFASKVFLRKVEERIIKPTIEGLRKIKYHTKVLFLSVLLMLKMNHMLLNTMLEWEIQRHKLFYLELNLIF